MKHNEIAQLKSMGSEVTLETRVNQLAAMISSRPFVSFYCASSGETRQDSGRFCLFGWGIVRSL